MRKWQPLAPPDDPGSWFDVDGVWPTTFGSYATVDYLDSGTTGTATGTGDVSIAWCANTLSSRREYVFTASSGFIWEYSAGTYTDRTGGVTVGSLPFPVQYGDITIVAMGAANATVKSSGGNFSALAGSPNCEILLTVAGAVLALNTNTSADGWAASDVGDYTNWTTGEAASGRLLQTPGAITAGVSFGNYAIVFKSDAIYRISYVGGVVKWTTELLYRGIGCQSRLGTATQAKYAACAGGGAILFVGYYDTALATSYYYTFDGVSAPQRANPVTAVSEGPITYNPQTDTFSIYTSVFSSPNFTVTTFFHCRMAGMWGKYTHPATTVLRGPLLGDYSANADKSTNHTLYGKSAGNTLKRYVPGTITGGSRTGTCYLQTSMVGTLEGKLNFTGAIPRLRRYKESASGSPATACTVSLYSEMYGIESGAAATAADTATGAQSTLPRRQDFSKNNNFARVKIAWTDTFIDCDDFIVNPKSGGKH